LVFLRRRLSGTSCLERVVKSERIDGDIGEKNSSLSSERSIHLIYSVPAASTPSSPPQQTIMPSQQRVTNRANAHTTPTDILLQHWQQQRTLKKPSAYHLTNRSQACQRFSCRKHDGVDRYLQASTIFETTIKRHSRISLVETGEIIERSSFSLSGGPKFMLKICRHSNGV